MTNDRILLLVFTVDTDHELIYFHHPSGHNILLDVLKKKARQGVAIISEMNKYFENEVLTQAMTY